MKDYIFWLKKLMRTCFPMQSDWENLKEAWWANFHFFGLILIRMMVLFTAPLSVPLLAWLCYARAKKVNRLRENNATS